MNIIYGKEGGRHRLADWRGWCEVNKSQQKAELYLSPLGRVTATMGRWEEVSVSAADPPLFYQFSIWTSLPLLWSLYALCQQTDTDYYGG